MILGVSKIGVHSFQLDLSSQWIFPLIQGYVEVRQIPVLSEDTPKVLQADWSVLYQETRQRLLQEVQKEKGMGQRRGSAGGKGRRDTGSEIELQNMASVVREELVSKSLNTCTSSLNSMLCTSSVPLKELRTSSGSEYEMYDGSSASEDDSPTTFSPLKFTDKREGGGAGGVAGGGDPAGQDTEPQSDPEWSLIQFSPTRQTREGVVSTGDTVHRSNDVQSEQPTHCKPMTSRTADAALPEKEEKDKSKEEQDQTSPTSGCFEKSTNSGQPLFYSVKDTPDFEGGVMIDLFDSAEACNNKEEPREGGAEPCSREGGGAEPCNKEGGADPCNREDESCSGEGGADQGALEKTTVTQESVEAEEQEESVSVHECEC